MNLRRALVLVSSVALVVAVSGGTAAAKGGCKKAAKLAVEKIEGGGFGLVKPRQVKIPGGEATTYGVWLIAGRIYGGPASGQIGTWVRFKLTPQATGLYISYDDGAKAADPDLGADLDPAQIVGDPGGFYDRVVACAEKSAPS